MKEEIEKIIKGEVDNSEETLTKYSRDASLFEVRPELVVFPKDSDDLKNLVKYVSEEKKNRPALSEKRRPELSLTGRSAGTDMSGGAINESIILDFTKYFKKEEVDVENLRAVVAPGVFYRDFETETLPKHISLPVYPASKQLAALGGMIMNNAAGEKTLKYGQIRDFVEEVTMVLSDGNEYTFAKLGEAELKEKLALNTFEGELYRKTYDLVTTNKEIIEKAKPQTSKNSSGYALWRIYDADKKVFDLSQLFVGSQGTLGLLTEAKMRLIKEKSNRKLIALFFKSWDDLPKVVNEVLPYQPESLEAFDDATLKLGIHFMPEIAKKAHEHFWKFALSFLPEAFIGLEMGGLPKLILLIELAEDSEQEVETKVEAITAKLKSFPIHTRILDDGPDSEKYWVMRRESFNLLRQHVKGKKTAPFIDDFVIDPAKMPEFLPRLLKILKDNDIQANIAGHAGNGNYHIIPLMDITLPSERAKIVPVAKEVYNLIIQYGGSISAEHNDGIMRTPFVEEMFGHEMYGLFEQVKEIFDPQNIFNPGKKVGGTLEYLEEHIATK